jgi:hypothetical protein
VPLSAGPLQDFCEPHRQLRAFADQFRLSWIVARFAGAQFRHGSQESIEAAGDQVASECGIAASLR